MKIKKTKLFYWFLSVTSIIIMSLIFLNNSNSTQKSQYKIIKNNLNKSLTRSAYSKQKLYSDGAILSNSLSWNSIYGDNIITEIVNDLSPTKKGFNTIKNENYNTANPKFIDLLVDYNNNNLDHKKLSLKSSNWSEVDLSKLSFFNNFQNIKKISFIVEKLKNDISQLGTAFNIKEFNGKLSWLHKMPNLKSIEFKFEIKPATLQKYSFDDFNFLNNMENLENINISKLVPKDPNFKIGGSIFNSEWYLNLKRGTTIFLPNDRGYSSDDDTEVMLMNNIYKFSKKSSSPIMNPSFEDNESIFYDGREIKSYLINGTWYWGFNDVNDIKKIEYANIDARKYYSKKQTTGLNAWKIQKYAKNYNFDKNKIESMLKDHPILSKNITKKSLLNGDLNSFVIINNVKYKYNLIKNSKAYLNYPKWKEIKYMTTVEKEIKFFTSVDTMSLTEKRVANSIKPISTEFPEIFNTDLEDPENIDDKIFFNSKNAKTPIRAKFIYGKLYWSLNNSDSNFKYYSKSKKFIAESIDDFKIFSIVPKDINPINKISPSENMLPLLRDGIKINGIEEYKKLIAKPATIYIDDTLYSMAIRRGRWYYDAPIDKINFAYILDKGIKYYTSYKKVISLKLDLKKVIQINKLNSHFIPPKIIIKQPPNKLIKSNLLIDGIRYESVIIEGKRQWIIDQKILKSENIYIDEYGYIYTKIEDKLPLNISNASWNKFMKTIYKKKIIPSLMGNVLSNNAILNINQKYLNINDQLIPYVFYKSKIYFVGIDKYLKNDYILAVNYKNEKSISLYTNNYLKNKSNIIISLLWEVEKVKLNDWKSIKNLLPEIVDPKNKQQKLEYIQSDGKKRLIKAINVNGKLYWNYPEKVRKFKYEIIRRNNSKFYIFDLNMAIDEGVISSISKVDVSDYDSIITKSKKIIKTEGENIRTIVIISVSSFGVAIIMVIAYLMYRRKRR